MSDFWHCFVPLFVAVDPIGVLPVFMSLTEGIQRPRVRRIILQSVFSAAAVALLFLALGKGLLRYLGVTVADFMVAGGALLFGLSVSELLTTTKQQSGVDPESLGAVPLGVPLLAGPAVLTTAILLIDQYGPVPTGLAIVLNLLFAGLVFWASGAIYRVLGKTGAKIISKLASLLLAAIAVMMVRKGVLAFLSR